jgi:hypothetical protein
MFRNYTQYETSEKNKFPSTDTEEKTTMGKNTVPSTFGDLDRPSGTGPQPPTPPPSPPSETKPDTKPVE